MLLCCSWVMWFLQVPLPSRRAQKTLQQLVLCPLGTQYEFTKMFLRSTCTLWAVLNLHLLHGLLFPPLLPCATARDPCVVKQIPTLVVNSHAWSHLLTAGIPRAPGELPFRGCRYPGSQEHYPGALGNSCRLSVPKHQSKTHISLSTSDINGATPG